MTRAPAQLWAIALCAAATLHSSAIGASAVCGSLPIGRTQRVSLSGRAYDVLIHPSGHYVVGYSGGVQLLDACTSRVIGGCEDRGGAYRLALGERGAIEYARGDGTVRACDPMSGRPVRPHRRALGSRREAGGSRVSAWVEDERAWSMAAGRETYALRFSEPALGVAVRSDGAQIAVSRRDGMVVIYSAPTGLPIATYRAHSRNAYAVRHDSRLSRWITVGGEGELGLRSAPVEARDYDR